MTINQGIPVSDNQNSLRATPRGPTLLENFIPCEKITHFDHERIPERIVHARASAAHGHFELTRSLKKYTTAKLLAEVGAKFPFDHLDPTKPIPEGLELLQIIGRMALDRWPDNPHGRHGPRCPCGNACGMTSGSRRVHGVFVCGMSLAAT